MQRAVAAKIASFLTPGAPCFGHLVEVTVPVGSRSIGKYARAGFWQRGEDGMHTMDDPRVFKPNRLRRKYPYYKQHQISKPYMCTRHFPLAPAGSAVKLAISFPGFYEEPTGDTNLSQNRAQCAISIDTYHRLREKLKEKLPGAQVFGHRKVKNDQYALPDPTISVLRLSDGQDMDQWPPQLSKISEGDLEALAEGIVQKATDNFDWRYPEEPEDVEPQLPEASCPNASAGATETAP